MRLRKWVGRGFLLWALACGAWLANSYRTQGLPDGALAASAGSAVAAGDGYLELRPAVPGAGRGLLFFCGSGVAAEAYVPLLRPLAEAGHAVLIVRLPYRFAPLPSQRADALRRARTLMDARPGMEWVLAGHSLGGLLAARFAQADTRGVAGLALLGTTHPREFSLAALRVPVAKVYGSNDGVARADKVLANKARLPAQTQWVAIAGGNHSQFGHYGHQLMDGAADIPREAQQAAARAALLKMLGQP